MSAHIDIEILRATDPDTGEAFDVARACDGYVLLAMTREEAERYEQWTEVKAVRIRVDGDTIAALEVSDDEEWLTDPGVGQ